ncbi:unnamed protein product [Allacma fusca]|uniref:Uncharacterized protein n=1 Tax=Allacma fusca TaxID=39272 RepID=A0A8J2NSL1_9HEXA|nr:unnamed protein product [Allacma fusca]
MSSGANPRTQQDIAQKLKISQALVCKFIKDDLGANMRKKTRVHILNEAPKQNRKTDSRKLYEQHLAGDRSEFAVTLDEAFFFLNDCKGERGIYYTKDSSVPVNLVLQCRERFSDNMMIVGAMTGRGVLPLIKVHHNVKINSAYYVANVLKPLLEDGVAKLYSEDCSKVFAHHDAASSHTYTQAYAGQLQAKTGIKLIANSEIPVTGC